MGQRTSSSRAERVARIFTRAYEKVEALGLAQQQIEDPTIHGDRVTLKGQALLNFGLASYLALGDDPRLKDGAKSAIDRYGTSYSSSIAYTSIPLYGELTERLAEIFGAQVVVAPSTSLAHLAALPVLIGPADTVIVDSRVHASVQVAAQLLREEGALTITAPHNDVDKLDRLIAETEGKAVWYLTDGVFSMDGDMSPAMEIHELLVRHERLNAYIDDAHGFSWEGTHGRGSYLNRAPWHERLVIAAGLSKSFGATGGVIATPDAARAAAIRTTGGPLVFGGPVPPAALGAGIVSADIHLSDEIVERQALLDERIDFVNRFISESGLVVTATDHTPIWFHEAKDVFGGLKLLEALKESGFYLNGAIFPVVPVGHAGLRFTITNYLSIDQIESMLTCLHEKTLEIMGDTEVVIDLDQVAAEEREKTAT